MYWYEIVGFASSNLFLYQKYGVIGVIPLKISCLNEIAINHFFKKP